MPKWGGDMNGISDIAGPLAAWRRSEGLTQAELALRLGVSQQAISYWERGRDVPGAAHMAKIRQLLTQSGELNAEKAFIRDQQTVRAVFDCDDLRMLACSAGFNAVWPQFAQLIEVPMRDDLVNESAVLYADTSFRQAIAKKEIFAISGISERHVRLPSDQPFKHRWFMRVRHFGSRMVGDMIFEPCHPDASVGVELFLKPDEWT